MKKKLWVMCLIFLMIFSSTIVRADVGTTIDLKDEWNIIGNGYKGTFTISEQTGNEFSGKVNYSGHGEQRLVDGKLVSDTMTFTRLWENSSLRQYYTGNLVIDSKGMISASGTFTQTGTTTVFKWSATKIIPVVTAPTPTSTVSSPSPYDLRGVWQFSANNHALTFEITEQNGSNFSGVGLGTGYKEKMLDGKLIGDVFTFTRDWGSTTVQKFTGKLVVDSKGMASLKGTLTQTASTYTFNWTATKTEPMVISQTSITTGSNMASPFDSGVRISWVSSTGLGYRLFRSTVSGELGISVTDFYITSTSYADVNVEANTTYYYSVKPVIAEAKPFEGIEEQLGAVIATFTVKTGNSVYKPGSFKHFIMLEMDNPMMTDNGTKQEIDPGRGTTPLIISGRTMVPIRAIVEAMGGTLGWDNATSKITLKARGNVLEMWLNKTEILINGVSQKMDVAPVSRNGRTYVPVRFAAENLQSKVDYINSTREAVIIFEE